MRRCLAVLLVFCTASAVRAQQAKGPDAAVNPLSAAMFAEYSTIKGYIIKAADQMPEENYGFQPTPAVRTYGQLIGHLADAQYAFCAQAKGEKSPHPASFEKTMTAKADLVKALRDGFAYCDAVYAGLSDSQLKDKVDFFGQHQARLYVVSLNSAHDDEHYGNIVTYLRIKGLVPPSSQPAATSTG
jgi:uncharacterized damage-inducible protein DinB